MHHCEIPACEAHLNVCEMPISVGQLEAASLDDDRAIAPALGPLLAPGQGEAQGRAVWTRSRHLRALDKARNLPLAGIGVNLAIVLVFHPCLRCLIELGE